MMGYEKPIRVTGLRGVVRKSEYGTGSKSEREAVFLVLDDRRYILRRKDGPVFDDSELTQFLGLQVECDGFVLGTTLLTERIDVVA